jgi:predicted transcriptional regulator
VRRRAKSFLAAEAIAVFVDAESCQFDEIELRSIARQLLTEGRFSANQRATRSA